MALLKVNHLTGLDHAGGPRFQPACLLAPVFEAQLRVNATAHCSAGSRAVHLRMSVAFPRRCLGSMASMCVYHRCRSGHAGRH
jgi:hypothetical protein